MKQTFVFFTGNRKLLQKCVNIVSNTVSFVNEKALARNYRCGREVQGKYMAISFHTEILPNKSIRSKTNPSGVKKTVFSPCRCPVNPEIKI